MRRFAWLGALIGMARVAAASTAVWIDTDVSIGSPIREVDDAYALLLACHSREIRIAGISTSYGNSSLAQTTRAAHEMVARSDCRVRIFSGAAAPRDDARTPATEGLARALKRERVIYVAIAPLTNLAGFLKLHPELGNRIDRVIFLGGHEPGARLSFGRNDWFRIHDANVFKDPAAAATVLSSGIPITLVPISTAARLQLDESGRHLLERSGDGAEYVARRSKMWLWFWKNVIKENGGPIFDALAVTAAVRPDLVGAEHRWARVDESGNLIASPVRTSNARRVRYCRSFAPQTKRIVLERLSKRGR